MRHKKNAVYWQNGSDFARHEPSRAARSARCVAAVTGPIRAVARVREKDRSAMGCRWWQRAGGSSDPRSPHDGAAGINGTGAIQVAEQSGEAGKTCLIKIAPAETMPKSTTCGIMSHLGSVAEINKIKHDGDIIQCDLRPRPFGFGLLSFQTTQSTPHTHLMIKRRVRDLRVWNRQIRVGSHATIGYRRRNRVDPAS